MRLLRTAGRQCVRTNTHTREVPLMFLTAVLVAVAMLLLVPCPADTLDPQVTTHPRLYFTPDELARLHQAKRPTG